MNVDGNGNNPHFREEKSHGFFTIVDLHYFTLQAGSCAPWRQPFRHH